MSDQGAHYGTVESWVATLAWSHRPLHEAVRAALERGDMPMPYGLSLDEATAHWAACVDIYCPLAFMGWRTEPGPLADDRSAVVHEPEPVRRAA